MKRISGILSISLLLFACGGNTDYEVGNKTTMEVNELYDAGDIVKGEKITAVFTIKNTGDYPLVIGEVKGSFEMCVVNGIELAVELWFADPFNIGFVARC